MRPSGLLPTTLNRCRCTLHPDSTIQTGKSDTESLPSLPNQDDADTITISSDEDLETTIMSFCPDEQDGN